LDSFTIITHPASGVLADYHTRAPVVLDQSEWMAWMDPAVDHTPFLDPSRADRFSVEMT